MPSFTNTVTIDRPARDVFAFLADLENVPRWNYAISETRKMTPGDIGVGTTYEQTRSIPTPSREQLTITEFEPTGTSQWWRRSRASLPDWSTRLRSVKAGPGYPTPSTCSSRVPSAFSAA